MSFRTTFDIPEFPFNFSYSDHCLLIGSCFVENIGAAMVHRKFNVAVNPFGTLYNPFSIAQGIELLLANRHFTENDLFFENELWNSFFHHSRFSAPEKETALNKINEAASRGREALQKSKLLVITFGTAFVYRLKETGEVVANCHKIPQAKFDCQLLTTHTIVQRLEKVLKEVKQANNNVQIIFTVSPIRHLKDGAAANMLSKALLITAAHELAGSNDFMHYFPSYEIMMDDLRDYRFYAENMIHPNNLAIQYIWQKFAGSLLSDPAKQLIPAVEKIRQGINHRPRNPHSEAHRDFIQKLVAKMEKQEQEVEGIDWSGEKEKLK